MQNPQDASSHPEHNHSHHHHTPNSVWGWVAAIFHLGGHNHSHEEHSLIEIDLKRTNQEAIRTVWLALAALGATTIIQIGIVALSGSVALLADTIHNIGDTLNSIPLLLAFYLARKAATRRYTYGFGRAEDVAGIVIVLSIMISAVVVFWESIQKLLNPQPMQHLGWVAAAAFVGFVGNEAVALLQIRTGHKIGSDAMIADGLHARIDGLTSLAVLIAAGGTFLGFPIIDPLIGLLIGVTILFITKDAAIRIWYRLMDAVDPSLIDQIEHHSGEVAGVAGVEKVRAHWVGHQLFAELTLVVNGQLTLEDGEMIRAEVTGRLQRVIPRLGEIHVQMNREKRALQDTADPLPQPEWALSILPPRYQLNRPVSAAPMGAAGLVYGADGKVAWDQIWQGFCDLALAGGPPHRGTLLEPIDPDEAATQPEAYEQVLEELDRGIKLVTGLETVRSTTAGWIGMRCTDEAMALWLLRAIVVENVSVRREGNILYFPVGPNFRLEKEIKNVITVIAKTHHYWQEHASG